MGNFKDVAVIDVLVKPGETIEPEAPLVTLETEKATMDVPSTASGVIEKIHVAKGGTVSPGDLIVTVRSSAEAVGAGAQSAGGASGASGAQGASSGSPSSSSDAQGGSPGSYAGASGVQGGSSGSPSGASGPQRGAGAQPGIGGQAGTGGAASAPAGTGGSAAGGASASASGNVPGGASGASSGSSQSASSTAPVAAASSTSSPLPKATPATASGNGATSNGASRAASGVQSSELNLPPINEPGFSRAHAGPSVRKFARELGVDLTRVKGSGFKGRITHDDVKGFVKTSLSPAAGAGGGATARAPGAGGGLPTIPAIDFAAFGPVESKPLSRIQKISGPRLHASWVNIPHVTQFDEADITDLEATRNRLKEKAAQAGIKLTPLAFIIQACVKALQKFPQFNASLDPSGANLILKKYFHVGFAADTPNGLVVPVVHDADRKDIYKVARELGELSEKARAGKLSPNDMQGGCFTISSLGGIGGTAFTPIINAPEVAILGVSRSAMKPVYRDGNFVPRLILPLSLSYDHRVIDGATAARFTTFLAESLANVAGLIEAVP
jgi:pyruvate dehydrogenase E2 component (dihydrolipoamide acetyltransferase)